jgi:hypothetical protein
MENFNELQQAVAHKANVEEYLKRIKSIDLIGQHGIGRYVGITDHANERYTFSGVAKIIGEEKLQNIVKQFEGLLNVELQNAKEAAEQELSKFRIIRNDN